MPDADETGILLHELIMQQAKEYMPTPVQLEVINTSLQQSAGYVVCLKEGRRVRCLVPGHWSLAMSNGNTAHHLIWALPLTGKASGSEFIALWPSWNDTDSSRTTSTALSPIVTTFVGITLNSGHEVVLVDATIGGVTIALPKASTVKGKHYFVKKIDSSGNSVTIDGNGSETIDNSATKATSTQYAGWHFVSNGVAWHIIGTF